MSSQGASDDDSSDGYFDDDFSENGGHFQVECPNSAVHLERVRKALTRMVCTEDCPPRITESPHFKGFMKTLNPFVELGDFESFTGDCLKFYDTDAIRVKQTLRNMVGMINLSVETFRSEAFKDFMCLTAHFIGENWKPKKWVLGFQTLHWESIAGSILKCLEHWGIRDKAFTLALKSYTIDAETVEEVKDYIQEKNQLQVGGKLFHVYCCAELLASMAQDALEGISKIVTKLQCLISWGKSEQWSTTNRMLKEALELQSKGEITSDRDYIEYLLSAEEWEKVKGVSKLVDKLHTVAEVLFHAKHPNASLFLVNLHVLHVSLMEQDSIYSSCNFVSAIREKMLQKFEKYWENMFLLLAVAAVMDPRCKMAYIEHLSSKAPGSNGSTQSSAVLEIVGSLYDNYLTSSLQLETSASDSCSSDCEIESSSSEEEDLSVSGKKRKGDLVESDDKEEGDSNGVNVNITSHLQDYKQYIQATSRPPQSELDLYLEEPVLAWDQDFKLLKWWRTQRPKYPILSRMARDLLSIPFSVATSYDAYYIEDDRLTSAFYHQTLL